MSQVQLNDDDDENACVGLDGSCYDSSCSSDAICSYIVMSVLAGHLLS